jgi:hypothetical protein
LVCDGGFVDEQRPLLLVCPACLCHVCKWLMNYGLHGGKLIFLIPFCGFILFWVLCLEKGPRLWVPWLHFSNLGPTIRAHQKKAKAPRACYDPQAKNDVLIFGHSHATILWHIFFFFLLVFHHSIASQGSSGRRRVGKRKRHVEFWWLYDHILFPVLFRLR